MIKPPSIEEDLWKRMLADGYSASRIKGSPEKTHARKHGDNVALCGKKPGAGGSGWKMRNRTGWYYYTDGRAPNCVDCGRAAKELPAPGSTAHLERAVLSGD